jgi:hypothetical protein
MCRRWSDRDPFATKIPFVVSGGVVALVLAVLGLPPAGLHGPQHFVGVMDPFCGMTRAVRALARGEFDTAWAYNPASFALALAALRVLVGSLVGRITGRWLTIEVLRPKLVRAFGGGFVVALWVNQQLHASRLA